MANELRKWSDWAGGLVEDNPLASGATTLNSAGLASLPAVTSGDHMLITFDPDGNTGAPYVKRVTAHTASATSATIEAAAVVGTARAIDRDVPWIHGMVSHEMPSMRLSRPTHASTRSSSTLGSLNNVWSDTIATVHGDQAVIYEVHVSLQCANDEVIYLALTRAGTIIDRVVVYEAGAGNRENRGVMSGYDLPGSASTHTYEVFVASAAAGTVTVNSTVSTSTTGSNTSDGVSSMRLQTAWRTT